MNIFRQPVRTAVKRTYATASAPPFVPPASLRDVDRRPGRHGDEKVRPASPVFYTGRASYYDQVIQLETAVSHSRHALTQLQLLPLPAFAKAKLAPLQPVWKRRDDMAAVFNSILTTARYRRVTTLLNQLNDYKRIALTAGCYELENGIAGVVQIFERENREAVLARGKRKPVKFDQYGRTYTVGKRKSSAARVWVIPMKHQQSTRTPTPPAASSPSPPQTDAEAAEALLGLAPSTPLTKSSVTVQTSTVLVNNIPLAEYFPIPADRERVIRPLKIAGVLGGYNVFALVRGGGTSGQSGAVALGIAKGIAAHEPSVETVLRRAKLMRRDPRMVERKKTGMAKARKRYTWVKR